MFSTFDFQEPACITHLSFDSMLLFWTKYLPFYFYSFYHFNCNNNIWLDFAFTSRHKTSYLYYWKKFLILPLGNQIRYSYFLPYFISFKSVGCNYKKTSFFHIWFSSSVIIYKDVRFKSLILRFWTFHKSYNSFLITFILKSALSKCITYPINMYTWTLIINFISSPFFTIMTNGPFKSSL